MAFVRVKYRDEPYELKFDNTQENAGFALKKKEKPIPPDYSNKYKGLRFQPPVMYPGNVPYIVVNLIYGT